MHINFIYVKINRALWLIKHSLPLLGLVCFNYFRNPKLSDSSVLYVCLESIHKVKNEDSRACPRKGNCNCI